MQKPIIFTALDILKFWSNLSPKEQNFYLRIFGYKPITGTAYSTVEFIFATLNN